MLTVAEIRSVLAKLDAEYAHAEQMGCRPSDEAYCRQLHATMTELLRLQEMLLARDPETLDSKPNQCQVCGGFVENDRTVCAQCEHDLCLS